MYSFRTLLNTIITSLLILIGTNYMFAQDDGDLDNYFDYYDHMMEYFEQQATTSGIEYWEVDGWKEFNRWAIYYENKHDIEGYYVGYAEALSDYYSNPVGYWPNEQPNWAYIGHDGIYPNQNGYYSAFIGQGNITTIWVDYSNPDYILAGGDNGRLWKTTDGGDNWFCISNTEPLITGICSIQVDENDPDKIYISSAPSRQKVGGYSTGLFYTSDAGITWTHNPVYIPSIDKNLFINGRTDDKVVKWIINPNDDNKMFLITWGKLLRSLDNGQTWEILLDIDYNHWEHHMGFKDIEFDPVDYSTIYVTGVDVHKLTNDGDNIEDITEIITQHSSSTDGKFKILTGVQQNFPNKIWFAIKAFNGTDNLVYYDKSEDDVILLHEESDFYYKSEVSHFKLRC